MIIGMSNITKNINKNDYYLIINIIDFLIKKDYNLIVIKKCEITLLKKQGLKL